MLPWCARWNDDSPWIQVDFNDNYVYITGLITEGYLDPIIPYYVMTYTVAYPDGPSWIDVKAQDGSPQEVKQKLKIDHGAPSEKVIVCVRLASLGRPRCVAVFFQDERVQIITHVRPPKLSMVHPPSVTNTTNRIANQDYKTRSLAR